MNTYSDEVRQIIKDGGFYFTNNKGETCWNSIVQLPGDNRLYRKRVETLIVRNKKEIFVKMKPNGEYFLPGGSTEKDTDNIVQAENECHEETHFNIKNIVYTGITYVMEKEPPAWAKESKMPVVWDGNITEIYIAEYDGKYSGHIDSEDEDPFIRSGRFYSTKECMGFFRKEHKEAFFNWIREQKMNESLIKESYITNYFRNKKFLRDVGHSPELTKATVVKLIDMLKKEYSNLIIRSSIKREMKRDDVATYFHPVVEFDFSDGSSISLVLCFDQSSATPGSALHSDSYGDLIIIYPSFFKLDNEDQLYVLLHEIGHIRLHHVDLVHSHHKFPFGEDDTNQYRLKMIKKGKVMYPELYADMYAVLNGAKMYSILNTAIQKDSDDRYDYKLTNQEIANRYVFVTSTHDKYKSKQESGILMTPYDIASFAINEVVTESGLSSSEKATLQNMLYSFNILHVVKESVNDNDINTVKEEFNKINNNLITESDNDKDMSDMFKEAVSSYYNNIINDLNKRYEILSNLVIKEDVSDYQIKAYNILNKWKLFSEKKYEECPDDKFGIPETRSFPLNSKKRVQSACRLFAHAPEKYKKSLARRIKKAMDEYGIPMDFIGPKAEIRKYL